MNFPSTPSHPIKEEQQQLMMLGVSINGINDQQDRFLKQNT